MNRDEPTTIPEPTPNRCSCSFPHMPHDYCDGNPNALMFDILPCEGCGVRSDRTEYIGINLLNGHLRLCRACLDELNEKSPLLAAERRRAEAADRHGETVADALAAAEKRVKELEAERAEAVERCAKIAESLDLSNLFGQWIVRTKIAAAIRASIGGKP